MLITSKQTGEKLQAYYWLYANIGEIGLKKNRFQTMTQLLREHRSIGGHAMPIIRPDDIIEPRLRHLTFLEQDKPQGFSTKHTDQPIQSTKDVQHIVTSLCSEFSKVNAELCMTGQYIDTRVNRVKTSLQLTFNEMARDDYNDIQNKISQSVMKHGFVDFYRGQRTPHVTIASANTHKKPKRVTQAFELAVKNDVGRVRTQKININELILGQSFYTENGKRHAERVIAKIDIRDAAAQWYCDDPFDMGGIGRLLSQSSMVKSATHHGLKLAA